MDVAVWRDPAWTGVWMVVCIRAGAPSSEANGLKLIFRILNELGACALPWMPGPV